MASSPPQTRRGGAPSAGVVVISRCASRSRRAQARASFGLRPTLLVPTNAPFTTPCYCNNTLLNQTNHPRMSAISASTPQLTYAFSHVCIQTIHFLLPGAPIVKEK